MKKPLNIRKIDAAGRQLETAIELFFLEKDPVSIHTLAAAVYGMLQSLNQRKGGNPMLEERLIEEYAMPGKEKELCKKLNEAKNFFKHAEHDPEGAIEFYPESNEYMLWEAAIKYSELTGESTRYTMCMNLWFHVHHADMFTEEYKKQFPMEAQRMAQSVSRVDFFRIFMALDLRHLQKTRVE